MRATGIILATTLVLAGCGPKAGESNAADGQPFAGGSVEGLPADFAKAPMKEFMGHVMQYSADNVWKWQGYVTDGEGERSLFPKTDAEWMEAESAALTLADLTNIMLLPGRAIDDPKWAQFVAVVRAKAKEAASAAEKKNEDAFFLAGSDLYEACKACHVQFAPNYQQPPEITVNGQNSMN